MREIATRFFDAARLLTAQAWPSEARGVYVGYCPELDVYAQGENAEEALEAVIEAARVYLQHAGDRRRQS